MATDKNGGRLDITLNDYFNDIIFTVNINLKKPTLKVMLKLQRQENIIIDCGIKIEILPNSIYHESCRNGEYKLSIKLM